VQKQSPAWLAPAAGLLQDAADDGDLHVLRVPEAVSVSTATHDSAHDSVGQRLRWGYLLLLLLLLLLRLLRVVQLLHAAVACYRWHRVRRRRGAPHAWQMQVRIHKLRPRRRLRTTAVA